MNKKTSGNFTHGKMDTKRTILNDLLGLIFPRICIVCGDKLIQDEEYICLKCLLHLPRTNFHLHAKNRMEQLFYGRVPVEKAYAYFEFRKGSNYQKILHQLKYKGQKELGEFLGKRFAAELLQSGIFPQIDLICPVPLHPKKEKKRGYNQSFHIAKGLSAQFGVPVIKDNIRRIIQTGTQTKKSRFERWQNVEGIFEVTDPQLFDGKHLVLVDDVITTGATLEACISAILSCSSAKISVLTLAIA